MNKNHILGYLRKSNSIFTVGFIKKNGEERVMNAIPNCKKYLVGSTNPNYSNTHKATIGVFGCYELQFTKEEREIAERQGVSIDDKVLGYKSFAVDSLKWIKVRGRKYSF